MRGLIPREGWLVALLALVLAPVLIPAALLAGRRLRRRGTRTEPRTHDLAPLARISARTDAARMTETDLSRIRAAGM